MGFEFHHIGIAVKSLDKSMGLYRNIFGMEFSEIQEVDEYKVKTAFAEKGKIKLVEAKDSR